jgi:hypothetical protein
MIRFETAVDDYFHQVVRTRPWTKKEDEALLTAFATWLDGQPVARLDEITPALVRAYVQHARLGQAAEQAFYTALHRLYSWAEWQGLVPAQTLSSTLSIR